MHPLRKAPKLESLSPFIGRVTLMPLVNGLWDSVDRVLAPLGITARQGAMLLSLHVGEASTAIELARVYGVEESSATRMLERMERTGWVARGSGDRWVLTRGADQLQVADVYRAFIMDAGSLRSDAGAEMRALHELLAGPRAGLEATLQVPVSELYGDSPAAEEPLRRSRVLEIIRKSERR